MAKIWVRATGNPVKRPMPDTNRKPAITGNPVEVEDTVHIRRLITIDESLQICAAPEPVSGSNKADAVHPDKTGKGKK